MNPEAVICAAAVASLRTDGWTMGCEVPYNYRNIDAAGIRADGRTIAVEAKVGCCPKLEKQLKHSELAADFLLAVVGRRPNLDTIRRYSERGYTLWLIQGDAIIMLSPMMLVGKVWAPEKAKLIERVNLCKDEVVGGVPCLPGVGVAQEVQRAVDAYRAANPKATWKEIFAAVPSHYANYKNLYSALRSNAERMDWKVREKAGRRICTTCGSKQNIHSTDGYCPKFWEGNKIGHYTKKRFAVPA